MTLVWLQANRVFQEVEEVTPLMFPVKRYNPIGVECCFLPDWGIAVPYTVDTGMYSDFPVVQRFPGNKIRYLEIKAFLEDPLYKDNQEYEEHSTEWLVPDPIRWDTFQWKEYKDEVFFVPETIRFLTKERFLKWENLWVFPNKIFPLATDEAVYLRYTGEGMNTGGWVWKSNHVMSKEGRTYDWTERRYVNDED